MSRVLTVAYLPGRLHPQALGADPDEWLPWFEVVYLDALPATVAPLYRKAVVEYAWSPMNVLGEATFEVLLLPEIDRLGEAIVHQGVCSVPSKDLVGTRILDPGGVSTARFRTALHLLGYPVELYWVSSAAPHSGVWWCLWHPDGPGSSPKGHSVQGALSGVLAGLACKIAKHKEGLNA